MDTHKGTSEVSCVAQTSDAKSFFLIVESRFPNEENNKLIASSSADSTRRLSLFNYFKWSHTRREWRREFYILIEFTAIQFVLQWLRTWTLGCQLVRDWVLLLHHVWLWIWFLLLFEAGKFSLDLKLAGLSVDYGTQNALVA